MEKKGPAVPKARTQDLVTRDMPDEVLVYDMKTHQAHCLNQTAATVWKYCDGETTVSEITMRLQSEHKLKVEENAVWLAVNRLSKANLLKERIKLPLGIGRRAALRIGTALAVPVVASIIAPTAQAACTGGGALNATCTGTSMTGSPGVVSCTVCLSTCCAGGAPATGTCQALAMTGLGGACTRDCQCAPGTCNGGSLVCV
jgi:hypothetical protein